jgi:hypothetical protein
MVMRSVVVPGVHTDVRGRHVARGQCRRIADMEGEDESQAFCGILHGGDQLGLVVMHEAGQRVGERLGDVVGKLGRLFRCWFSAEQHSAVPEQPRPQYFRGHTVIAVLQKGQYGGPGAAMQQLAQFLGLSLAEMHVHVHHRCGPATLEPDAETMPRTGAAGPRLAGQPHPEVPVPRR